jgi:NAD(P)-dependent dehydrogenase (short-subunit alcohol dehydrogenase family)
MTSLNKYDALGALPKDWAVTAVQFTRKVYTTIYPSIDPTQAKSSLKGKTVVVTGASQGIGARGIAPAFVKAGVKTIVLVARSAANLANVEKELKSINPEVEVHSLSVDIFSTAQVEKAWAEINAKYNKVDILINNAGIEASDGDKTHELNPDIFFRNFVSHSANWRELTNRLIKPRKSMSRAPT